MINGIPTLAYRGVNAPNPPNFMSVNRAPTPNDADFPLGTIWLNESNQAVYMLVKFNGTANGVTALWSILASGSTGNVTLIGNAGTATEDVLGNINVFGDTPNIQVTGDNTNTLTVIMNDDIIVDNISADNINLPNSDPSVPEGYINFGGTRFIHNLGVANTFIGTNSANLTLTGTDNTVVGAGAFGSAAGAEGNCLFGFLAGSSITESSFNCGIGFNSLNSLIDGSGANIAIGQESLSLLEGGADNICIGTQAGSSYTGMESNNICIGTAVSGVLGESGIMRLGDNGTITDTFIAGQTNVELGLIATTGNVQTDDGNMIIGSTSNDADANALIFLKQRISSTVQTGDTLGNIDFRGLDGGSYIPAAAISSTVAGTVGVNQVGGTLEFYTTQAIAAAPPSLRMTIDQNGTITTNLSGGNTDAIIVTAGDVTLDNGDLIVSDGSLTVDGASSVVTFVNVPGTVIANDVPLLINSVSGELGTTSSSRRYKDNIVDMGEVSAAIMQLRPVTFTMKDDKSNQLRYGLIAEEVDQVLPDIVGYHKDGQPDYVRYHDLPCMLLNELQKQQNVIADLLNRVKILEDASSVN